MDRGTLMVRCKVGFLWGKPSMLLLLLSVLLLEANKRDDNIMLVVVVVLPVCEVGADRSTNLRLGLVPLVADVAAWLLVKSLVNAVWRMGVTL